MDEGNIKTLKEFDLSNIPDLDVVVLGALELFSKENLPKLNISYKRPMVVGSGNAEATGRIIFKDIDAVFASESNYEEKLRNIEEIDGVVLVSASGGKHAPAIASKSKEYGKSVSLITNNSDSEAAKEIGSNNVYVFPKNREPYTYNTSTYMGMMLGQTKENPEDIYNFIKNKIDTLSLPDFSKYDKFYIIVPPEFSEIIRMLQVKFIELFGRRIARDVETSEYIKHATTVVPSDELFISFDYKNTVWGEEKNRLHIPLPDNAKYGSMMAISYYLIGKIQKSHPPYFKENIVQYTEEASRVFNQKINPIVE